MKLRIRRKRRRPALMLTSLLDMFTIILIFMIVSFEAEDYEFRLNPDLELPESSARSLFKPAVNVAITRTGVLVLDELVAPFTDGRAAPGEYESKSLPTLVTTLEKVLAAQRALLEGDEGPIVMLQADKDLDYETLYLVMRSAKLAGYAKYRLTIIKK